MAQVVAEKSWPQGTGIHPATSWAPRLSLRVAYLLVISFTVVCVWVIVQMRFSSQPPFAVYADIFPGQPRSAAEARGFACRSNTYPSGAGENCTLRLETGVFSNVGILSSGGIIRYTNFIVRDGAVRLGDLEVILGTPNVKQYGPAAQFAWSTDNVTAMTYTYSGQVSRFLPLWSVSFADPEPET